jgi:hypothetical protein
MRPRAASVRLINLGIVDNVCLVHRDGNHKWQYEVPLKD